MNPPIELEEAGIIFAHAQRITAHIAAGNGRADAAAIPEAVANWGDARMLFPALLALLSHLYPELKDEARLDAILRGYLTNTASGTAN